MICLFISRSWLQNGAYIHNVLSNPDEKAEMFHELSFYNKKTVVVHDIGFCNPDVFSSFVDELSHYVCVSNIHVILMEKDTERFNNFINSMSNERISYYLELERMYDMNHPVYQRFSNFVLNSSKST